MKQALRPAFTVTIPVLCGYLFIGFAFGVMLRDAGFTAKSYLWLLLPVVGWLIFIVKRLCARSVD